MYSTTYIHFNRPKSQGHFEKNELKRSALFNHYGDQRAELELAVDKVICSYICD